MTPVRATAKKTSAEEDRSQLRVTVIQDPLLLGTNDPKTVMQMKKSLKNKPVHRRFFFSFRKSTIMREKRARSTRARAGREKGNDILSFPHHHPLGLAVIKSSAVFIFIRALDARRSLQGK